MNKIVVFLQRVVEWWEIRQGRRIRNWARSRHAWRAR